MEYSLDDILGRKLLVPNQPTSNQPISNTYNLEDILSMNVPSSAPAVMGEYQLTSKYDKGVLPGIDINKYRGKQQPWYEQLGAATNQAITGEIIGGTLMSLGSLLDAPDIIAGSIGQGEEDFSNWLYEAGKSISDYSRDITPIYQTGERFTDSGWWFQNGVSAASTLSMMLPGMGVAKGVGALGKAMRLGKTAIGIAETGLGALTMRHAENFREASDVYKTIYDRGVENGLDDEDVKKVASNAASLDYTANYANLAFDVIQLGAILRPLKGLTRNVEGITGNLAKAGDELLAAPKYAPTSRIGKITQSIVNPAKVGLAEWTEGIEEGINTISQFEGFRQGNIELGLQKDDGSDLTQRVGKYLGTQEMQDAMLWGMTGGVMFKGVSMAAGFDENASTTKRKIAELQGRADRINKFGKVISEIQNNPQLTVEDRTSLVQGVQDDMIKDLTYSAARTGNIDILIDQVKDPKFAETLQTMGIGTKEEIAQNVPNLVNKIEQYESTYKKTFNRFYEADINENVKDILVRKYADVEGILAKNNEELKNLEIEGAKLKTQDAWYQSQILNPDVNNAIEATSLQYAKIALENTLEEDIDEHTRATAERALNNVNKRIGKVQPTSKPINLNVLDSRIIDTQAEQIVLQEFNKELANTIADMTTPKNIEKEAAKVQKNIDNFKKTIEDNKNIADAEEASGERKNAQQEVSPEQEFADALEAEEVITEEVKSEPTKDIISDKEFQKFVDEGKVTKKRLKLIAEKVKNRETLSERENAIFTDKTAEINSLIKSMSVADVQDKVDNSGNEDGKNVDVNEKDIEIEEEVNLVRNAKRLVGMAINYLVTKYEVFGKERNKTTIDPTSADTKALVASEWGSLTPGSMLTASLDRNFKGEVDEYVYHDKGQYKRVKKGTEYSKVTTDFNEIFEKDKIDAPIKIQSIVDGKVVFEGYLPTIKWLSAVDDQGNYENLANTEEYPAINEIERVRKIRESIVNGDLDAKYEFVVESKGLGRLVTAPKVKGVKELKLMSESLPSLLTSDYYGGNAQPFTIYNKGFKVGNNVDFAGEIAASQATIERLNEVGTGGVFLMIPSSKPNVFIPTPISTPILSTATSKMLSQVISARSLGDNQELLDKITKNFGVTIGNSSRNLKEFLENYVYFTTQEDVEKTEGTGKVKWYFDTKTSTITFNLSNGSKPVSIALNAAQKNPTEFNERMKLLEETLTKTKQSVKLSKINSTEPFYNAVLDQDGNVDFVQTTYNKYLADNILTDLIELKSANDVPVYTTQPVITIAQIVSKSAEINGEIKEDFAEINLDDFTIDNFHLNNLEDIIPTGEELSIGVEQSSKIKEYAYDFLVKDEEYVYSSDKQRAVTKTIASDVYTQLLDADKLGNKLPVSVAFANARKNLEQIRDVVGKVLAQTPEKGNELVSTLPQLKWLKSYENAQTIKKELDRLLKPEVYAQFKLQVIQDLKNLSIDVKENSIEDFTSDEVKGIEEASDEGFIEGNDGQFEKAYTDFATFQMDAKDTAGWRVKLLLSTIRTGKTNFLGLSEYLPFDTVFDDLQGILWNVDGNIEYYIGELKRIATDNSNKGYINSVVKLLESSETPWSIKNNFISVMQKAHNEFKLLKWKRGGSRAVFNKQIKRWEEEEFGWQLIVMDSNRHTAIGMMVESWNDNFKESKYIKNVGGELVVNRDKTSKLLDEIKALKTLDEKKAFTKQLFEDLGIDMTDKSFNTIVTSTDLNKLGKGKFKVSGSFEQQFGFSRDGKPNGIISSLVYALTTQSEQLETDEDADKFSLNNPFTGENSEQSVKFLAKVAADYGIKLHTNTHRSVNKKQIYDYSFYTPERLKIEQLNKNSKGILGDLKKSMYTGFATYLDKLQKGAKLNYYQTDGLSQIKGTNKGVVRQEMSGRELILTSLGYFQKVNKDNRVIYTGLTHSDKTFSPLVEFEKEKISIIASTLVDGKVTKDSFSSNVRNGIQKLVQAEVSRIVNAQEKKSSGAMTIDNVGEQYFNGSEYFYFFPTLNETIKNNPQALNNIDALTDLAVEELVNNINGTIDNWTENGIVYKDKNGNLKTAFNEAYVNNSGLKDNTINLVAYAAADWEYNHFVHNANMIMLVHGDPAMEYKQDKKPPRTAEDTDETYAEKLKQWEFGNIDTTLKEYEKRLAKDSAPGMLGHYKWQIGKYGNRSKYNIVIANDIKNGTETEGYIRTIGYDSLERTDAQEWTTLEEKLFTMMSYGRIPDVIYKSIMDKIDASKVDGTYSYELTEEEKEVVLQPMKPVQVYTSYDSITGAQQVYYIKSSSYPLIPQLTKGLDLDKVRVAMEKGNVDRLAFKTAVKVGHRKLATIADEDGNILDNLDFTNNVVQLDRSGFLIQQDIPYEKGKHRIVTISQMNKLLFEGIGDLKFNFRESEYTGTELKKVKEKFRIKLMELSAKELYTRMGIEVVDGQPIIKDVTKLLPSIQEEAESRGWALNDINSLAVDENGNILVPLAFNNSASRIESLILSMFTNTIIKQKINGKSLVQGTSAGMKSVKTLWDIKNQNEIVFIKGKYNPAKGLQHLDVDDTFKSRAQILIPWKFAGELKNYIKDGYLDTDKMDAELLNLIGARIPNQGHSSQLAVEVVGFLPESMGDLVIVPGEITAQMGSDFDVDKLYTYIYNNLVTDDSRLIKVPSDIVNIDGKLNAGIYNIFIKTNFKDKVKNVRRVKKIFKERAGEKVNEGFLDEIFEGDLDITEDLRFLGTIEEKTLQGILKDLNLTKEDINLPRKKTIIRAALENNYIDIHNVVLTHPEVAKKCMNKLDKPDLKELGETARSKKEELNFLSPRRHVQDYVMQRAGKDGVGIFSRAMVGATVIQDYNLRLARWNKDSQSYEDTPFTGFKGYSLVKLSGTGKSKYKGEDRSKIDNIGIQQSGAVDNAKTPVLNMNDLNMATFNASIAISLLEDVNGNALNLEYNSFFLRQEIIKDYVKEMANLSDTINEVYVSDRKGEVKQRLVEKYKERAGVTDYLTRGKDFSPDMLTSLLKEENKNAVEYVQDQIEVLEHFMQLDAIGEELSQIFTAISTDSKGLGKSYWESSVREDNINNIGKKSLIIGAEELFEDSENGRIADYVKEANVVMGQLFPYKTDLVRNTIDYLEANSGKSSARVDVDFRNSIWEAMRMFMVSNTNLDIYVDRNSLFYGKNSLAKQLDNAKTTEWSKKNLFIQKLRSVKATKEGNPDLVVFPASFAERTDEADVIKAFTDLFISSDESVRNFAENLVKYTYANGGIQQALEFVKYIPTAYMRTTNFTSILNGVMNSFNDLGNTTFNSERFIEQFYQHNPQMAKKYSTEKKVGNSIVLSSENDSRMKVTLPVEGKMIDTFPSYISYRNTETNEWQLYKLSGYKGSNVVYDRINLLGGRGKDYSSYNEYNFNQDNVTSLIPKNNKGVPAKEIVSVVAKKESDIEEMTFSNPVATDTKVGNYASTLTGKAALDNAIDNLKTERFKLLGQLFKNSSEILNKDFRIISDNNLKSSKSGSPVRGRWDGVNTVAINPKQIKEFEKLSGREVTSESIEATLMHELLHGYTSTLYNDYRDGKENRLLTPKVKEHFKNIEVLYKVSYEKLTAGEKELVKKLQAGDTQLSANEAEKAKLVEQLAGFINSKEFISEAVSNLEFQKKLNDIPFSNKTVWDRFSQLVKGIFNEIAKTLGFQVKEGNVLESTLMEVMQLIEDVKGETLVSEQIKEDFSLGIRNKLLPFGLTQKDIDNLPDCI